jgi:hypothetical protein
VATEEFRCFTHVQRGGGGGEGERGVGTSSMPESYCFMSPQAYKKY